MIEIIEHQGTRYAEVIRANVTVETTKFFSPPESSFQFGLLAHKAGYKEPPHYHQEFERTVKDLQQMFVVQRGVVGVQLFDNDGKSFYSCSKDKTLKKFSFDVQQFVESNFI